MRVGDTLPRELWCGPEQSFHRACGAQSPQGLTPGGTCCIRADVPHPDVHVSTTGGIIHATWPVWYLVGDSFPDTHRFHLCSASTVGLLGRRYACTREHDHESPQHVAAFAGRVVAVWNGVHSVTAPPEYRVNDPDPTPRTPLVNRAACGAEEGGWYCTWFAGTDHPSQHVAGGGVIHAVWDYEGETNDQGR